MKQYLKLRQSGFAAGESVVDLKAAEIIEENTLRQVIDSRPLRKVPRTVRFEDQAGIHSPVFAKIISEKGARSKKQTVLLEFNFFSRD